MVWSLAPCLDDTEHDPRVYCAEFGVVVFMPKGPYAVSIQ